MRNMDESCCSYSRMGFGILDGFSFEVVFN